MSKRGWFWIRVGFLSVVFAIADAYLPIGWLIAQVVFITIWGILWYSQGKADGRKDGPR